MKALLAFLLLLSSPLSAQDDQEKFSIRTTVLLFPPRLLATVEGALSNHITIQMESDFSKTHGLNVKYFHNQPFHNLYLFAGNAWIRDKRLRDDDAFATISYLGVGYASPLNRHWLIDGRVGMGPVWNAETTGLIPVIKVGFGKTF